MHGHAPLRYLRVLPAVAVATIWSAALERKREWRRRARPGTPSTHQIMGDELRALWRLRREQEPKSPFVFTSERGAPLTTAGFARMIERAGH